MSHPDRDVRLNPPFWRHDAYTLAALARAVREQAQALAVRFDAHANRRAVDLGAGDAPYRGLFEARGFDYVACDLGDAAQIRIDPGQPVPLPDGNATVLLSFQVLEHVWDLDWYLGEARRLLADDGRLLLSTHGTWLYHPHPTDFRRWTRTGLEAELRQRGFEPESVQGLVGPLAWTTQFRALGYRFVLSKLPVLGPLLAAVLNSVMHLRMWFEDRLTPSQWIADNASTYLIVARKAPPTDLRGS